MVWVSFWMYLYILPRLQGGRNLVARFQQLQNFTWPDKVQIRYGVILLQVILITRPCIDYMYLINPYRTLHILLMEDGQGFRVGAIIKGARIMSARDKFPTPSRKINCPTSSTDMGAVDESLFPANSHRSILICISFMIFPNYTTSPHASHQRPFR